MVVINEFRKSICRTHHSNWYHEVDKEPIRTANVLGEVVDEQDASIVNWNVAFCVVWPL
jgi:hypothetical protein